MPHAPDQVSIVKIQELTDKEWEDLYSRLLLFARKWIGRRQFRVAPDPYDIASASIEKTLSGCRPWNSAQFSLFEHLCGVVRSEISNLVTSHDNKFTSSLTGDAEIASEDEPSVEDICVEKDLIDKFLDYLPKGVPHLREYARLKVVDGENRAKKCAERMNISVSEVYRLSKQLKQHATDFGAVRARGAEPDGETETNRPCVNGAIKDHYEESFPEAVSWACDSERSRSAIGDQAAPASGAFSLKCDGGHSNDKQ